MATRATILIALFIWLVSAPAVSLAGYLSDELQMEIAGKDSGDFIRVVIVPVSIDDPAAMKKSLELEYATRADRYRAGVARLQDAAGRSQKPVLTQLNALQQTGQARRVKTYWIADIIEAELTAGEIARLAADPAVEKIESYPIVTSIPMPENPVSAPSMTGVEIGLKAVKADSAWKAGYDGRGRIVCNFDTGVRGTHVALAGNYRGNKGYPWQQCWFSPTDTSIFPHCFTTAGTSFDHGTHTMGIMVGHNDITGDTIGIAPGADWIAAVAIDVPGTSVFEAFQWAADPDGDPNTVTDLPDVINHSWGIPGIGCKDIFWNVIDNVEALGIVNIFAAGNEGGAMTIRNPADRAADSITNFAVGALNAEDFKIYYASSRGPSDCDRVSIKPNVTAPGMMVRSAVAGSDASYNYYTGTSMAAPHVAGAVAILRQKNPDATVDQIKTALLKSTHDLGAAGPDYTFGWGIIDIMEALRQIDLLTQPSLQVAGLARPDILPGDIINLQPALKNVGPTAHNVTAQLSNPDLGLTVLNGFSSFGNIDKDGTATGSLTFDLAFDSAAVPGRFYSVDLDIYAAGGYSKHERLHFLVGVKGGRTYFHHDTGLVKFAISNYGAYGFYGEPSGNALAGSYIPLGFYGFQLDRDTNDLYEGALLIGTDSLHVSDCAHNIAMEPDNDFAVAVGGSIASASPGNLADQETSSIFNDSYAEHPIGLTITQRSYGWAADPDDRFVILEYILTNPSEDAINGIRVGLFLDWDIRVYSQNHGAFVPSENLGYLCWSNYAYTDSADFRGVKVLNPEGMTNYHIFIYDDIRDTNFREAKKYAALSDNFVSGTLSAVNDASQVTATGPFNLAPGASDTAAFAVVGGRSWAQFMEAEARAELKYNNLPTAADFPEDHPLPGRLALYQNYPNPFNPSTTIAFALSHGGHVRADIYDLLGRLIRTVQDGYLPAGEHRIVWDGADRAGRQVASGIYFYRVRSDDGSLTRKMILLK